MEWQSPTEHGTGTKFRIALTASTEAASLENHKEVEQPSGEPEK